MIRAIFTAFALTVTASSASAQFSDYVSVAGRQVATASLCGGEAALLHLKDSSSGPVFATVSRTRAGRLEWAGKVVGQCPRSTSVRRTYGGGGGGGYSGGESLERSRERSGEMNPGETRGPEGTKDDGTGAGISAISG